MTRGEKWKQFVLARGWIKEGVISGGDEGTLRIGFGCYLDPTDKNSASCTTALYLEEHDLLCCECPTGSIFFQWDNISHIKLEPKDQKKKWL